MADHSADFAAEDTGPDDPALMIFTSGTTGPPKGALHGHRVLLGHLPGVQMAYEFLPQPGDLMWTPADWAWAGGLLNALLPALYLGVPVVVGALREIRSGNRARADGEDAGAQRLHPADGAAHAEVRAGHSTALPARTALRRLGRRIARPRDLSSGRRPSSASRRTSSTARPNATSCSAPAPAIGVSRAGAIGKAVPGHRVAIIDGEGRRVKPGEVGQIAVARPDPVMFLEYWQNPEATAKKFIGDWMTTGDQGVEDEDGYVQFFGRDDDVITSAGFRIGPGEIEDCLTGHPAVALAAAVGKPDPLRTEIVKAYVVLKDGVSGSAGACRRDQPVGARAAFGA